jgi:hypothetical protein
LINILCERLCSYALDQCERKLGQKADEMFGKLDSGIRLLGEGQQGALTEQD